jgi:hypothetical protein
MGGDVWQWNEALTGGSFRGFRGGSFLDGGGLLSSTRIMGFPSGSANVGFRVVEVPEPSTFVLAILAFGLVFRRQLSGR